MGFLDGFGDWFGSLFGGSTPAVSYPNDPGGLSNVTASGIDQAPVFSSSAAPAAAAGGGFSLGGLNDVIKSVAPALNLATTGAGIGASIYGMKQAADQRATLEKEQQRQAQLAAPAAAAGQQLTAAGTNAMLGGPLPPQLESQVEQWKAQARANIRDYLAKAGITDSTMAQQFEAWIDQQAQSLRSQLAQNLLQSGYSGIGAAMGPSGQVSATASGLMGGTADAINAANKSIALLLGQTQNNAG